MPEKHIKIPNTKIDRVKWFDHYLKLMRGRLRLLGDLHKNSLTEDSPIMRNNARSVYRKALRLKKIEYNKKTFESATNKRKAIWKIINKARKCNRNKINNISNITSARFNNFFAQIATELTSGMRDVAIDPIQLLQRSCDRLSGETIHFVEVSSVVVRDTICDLKNISAVDTYDMTVKIVKSITNVIISLLTNLINQCISASRSV